jgi:hypothetical protein
MRTSNIKNPQKRRNPGVQVLITPKIKTQNKRHGPSVVLYPKQACAYRVSGFEPPSAKYIFPNLLKDAPCEASEAIK